MHAKHPEIAARWEAEAKRGKRKAARKPKKRKKSS